MGRWSLRRTLFKVPVEYGPIRFAHCLALREIIMVRVAEKARQILEYGESISTAATLVYFHSFPKAAQSRQPERLAIIRQALTSMNLLVSRLDALFLGQDRGLCGPHCCGSDIVSGQPRLGESRLVQRE